LFGHIVKFLYSFLPLFLPLKSIIGVYVEKLLSVWISPQNRAKTGHLSSFSGFVYTGNYNCCGKYRILRF
jgi:hypothetical protein